VPRFSSSLAGLRFVCLPALLLLQGCVGDNSGTTLYVYDNASSSVRVWDDVSAVYTAAQAGTVVAAPDRVIESSLYASMTLAWNGLAVDDTRNRLYLVSQAGTVYVIAEAKTQNGTLSSTSDITSFTLGESTERYSSDSVFGPASLDSSSDILYVMESSADYSAARVWRIASPDSQTNTGIVTPASSYTFGIGTDTYGAGVAALPGGGVFGLFGGGSAVYSSSETYTGPRLRYGPSGSFLAPDALGVSSDVLIGGDTLLSNPLTIGALGYDAQRACLYVFSGPATSSTEILVFNKSQFTAGTFDAAPARTLSDTPSTLADLRFIAHAPYADWLLGANYTATTTGTGTGEAVLFIWKAPSDGGSALQATLPDSTSGTLQIRGMAIGN